MIETEKRFFTATYTSIIFIILLYVGSVVSAEELTLKTAITEVMGQSPKLQKSKSVLDEAKWKKVESYSGFLPTLGVSANYLTAKKYMYNDINLGGANVVIPLIVPTTNMLATVQLPLFDGFSSTNRLRSAQQAQDAATQEFEWNQFQTEREATITFYKALASKELVEVAQQNIKTLQDHLRDIQLLKKAGIATNFDVLRVEVQLSEAGLELLNAQDNIDISKNKLSELLGKEIESREIAGQLPSVTDDWASALADFQISQRKDVIALQKRTDAIESLEKANGAYWVPKLNLFGQYQYYNNRNDRFNDYQNFRDAYQLGLSLTWNIFDGMISVARSRQSVEQKFQATKTAQIAQLKAKQDFEFWKRKLKYYSAVYKARVGDVTKSQEAVRLAKEGQRLGSRTNTDLLDAETELFRSKAGTVNAQVGGIEALINLELATGQKLHSFLQ